MRRPDGKYLAITTETALMAVISDILSTGHFCIDVETTSTDPMFCKLVGVSLSPRPGEGYYIPIAHQDGTKQLDWEIVRPHIAMLCGSPDVPMIFFNAIYDMVVLERYDCSCCGSIYDVMITEHTIDNGRYYRFNLAEVVKRTLNYDMVPITDLIGVGKNQVTFDQVPVLQATEYAAADVDMPLRLFYERRVENRRLVLKNDNVDFPLIRTLKTVMRTGIMVDLKYMHEMKVALEEAVILGQDRLDQLVGKEVSVLAYAALSKLLFDEMGLAPADGYGRSKAGNYTTSADHLTKIRHQHEIVDMILLLRDMKHVLAHHLITIVTKAVDHRIHTGFNLITATTRLSSSGPNLQNVSTGSVAGYKIRKGFVVPEGYKWVRIDYSQIELRVLAHMLVELFQDWRYAQIFIDGGDVHRDTAAAILGIESEAVDKDGRRIAKAINFGIIFGQSPGGLMYALDCSYAEAVEFYRAYLGTYPGIERWMVWQKAFGDKYGYVETPFYGMRRYIYKGNHTVALNHPVQGGAAEIMRKAMNEIQEFIEFSGCESRMLLQVHDEFDLEVPDNELYWVLPEVVRIMTSTMNLCVPLEVEVEVGPNWGELEKWEI